MIMKKFKYILILLLAAPVVLISCLKEDNVTDPVITDVKMFMTDKSGKDSLISEILEDKKIKIVVYTRADMVSIWPGGVRTIMKKKNSTQDSIDMFNNPVLVASDCYSDYGLVKARGLTTTVTEGGWYAFYTYANTGNYDLTIVATNHGYDGPDLRRVVYAAGKMSVK
jgi:hypothetical protein